MNAGINTDAAMFERTFKAYLAKSSKTLEEAINWKANDLMLTAAKHTPKSKLTAAQFEKAKAPPRLVSHRTGKKFGNAELKGWNRGQWDLVRNAMMMRTLGKGFMRSAWVKAAGKIPRTKLSKPKGAELEAARLEKSKADVRQIVGKIKGLAMDLLWQAHNAGDATLKQSMVNKALRLAVPEITASMQAYLRGEHIKAGKQASAK